MEVDDHTPSDEVLVLGQPLKSVNFQQMGGSPTITITHICSVYIYYILYIYIGT